MLSHERLDVYQCAIQFLALARRIVRNFPKGNADLADQLMRAARSSPLNIAEGAGKITGAERTRYWTHARGSAMESAACLDVAKIEDIISDDHFTQGKQLLERVVSMLTKMTRS
jgi:four helix bundle protein